MIIEDKKEFVVNYEEAVVDPGFRADFIMKRKLIGEITSVEHFEKEHHKTVLTYLKLSIIKLAILENFNVNLMKGIYRKMQGELC